MSTLKVDAIRHNSATSDAITTAADGTCTARITGMTGGGGLSHRNLIINGAMQCAQYGTSSSASGGGFTCDRFGVYPSGLDEAPTQTQHTLTSSDTGPYGAGFRNSLHIQNGNQTSGAGASDNLRILYKVEAQDIATSGWNYTSSSSNITLSFWVKSSVAQNFYIQFRTKDGTEQNYTTDTGSLTANTWTKVTKTIPGNSNLTFNNDNGVGTEINIWQFAGTDLTGSMTLNQWAAYSGSARMPDMASTWYTTDNATFEITGVQLEVGDTATSFEHRSFGEELLRCQRYFYQSSHWGTASGTGYAALGINYTGYQTGTGNWIWVNVYWPVVMRAAPTVNTSDQAGNTGNKHSIFTSTGGQRTNNVSNYHTSSFNDHCTVSNYWEAKYGVQVSGVRADAEL